ncbi:uncharacterized protein LOC120104291 [Phoenix dactylifera]|uniref:Uncharacterized protein LOC120104291 n=1 Tax=Phoenix dactylifera TaxID=42345 RepID=A0A8B8ZI55_PHODC|nr:uncharacterized protein LOC120104291 [Phoenix dactylifera]
MGIGSLCGSCIDLRLGFWTWGSVQGLSKSIKRSALDKNKGILDLFRIQSLKKEMLQEMIQPQEELAMEELSSPIASQILDFCDDIKDLFPDTLRTSEVSSCSGGGGGIDPSPCYDDNSFIPPSAFSPLPSSMDPSAFSALLDSSQPPPDDFAAVISSYPPPPPLPVPPTNLSGHPDRCDKSALADAIADRYTDYSPNSAVQLLAGPLLPPPPPSVYEEECLPSYMSTVSAYVGLDPPPFMDAGIVGGGGGLYLGGGMSVLEAQQSWYQGGMKLGPQETGMAPMDMVAGGRSIEFYGQYYSSTDLQLQKLLDLIICVLFSVKVLGDSHQHLVGGCGSPKPLVASDVSAWDDSSYKVGRLSVEERKEKIHRYMKKRNERNFSKKIKYACRKTLADNRPRVRGRFAKNDEFGEAGRPSSSTNQEYDDHEEVNSLTLLFPCPLI